MALHLWLRAETKPNERRTHLTPDKCKELVQAGFKITVEHSSDRIFKDDEFARIEGVNMVPAGSWVEAPKDTFILGLKELPHSSSPIPQTHIYFAHAYRYQSGWAQVLNRFTQGGGRVLDVEYMTDDRNVRVVTAFPPLAGVAGMAVGLSVWCHKQTSPQSPIPALKPYDSESLLVDELKSQLQQVAKAKGVKEFYPRIIVIGALGRCGKGALDMAFKAGIPSTHIAQWDLNETKDGGPFQKILDYDIFVNCIFLMKKIPPFLTREVLDTDMRQLSVVVDVSCDVTNPNNPLPFYDSLTSFEQPCHSIDLSNCTKPLDVVCIDNLPTLLPRESSVKFAENITPYLLKLPEADTDPVWVRARQRFDEKAAEALKQ